MYIEYGKQFSYVHNLKYPIKDERIPKDISDTDSMVFAQAVSIKTVKLCIERLEYLLSNNLDNFDLDQELSDLYETLSFAKKNFYII